MLKEAQEKQEVLDELLDMFYEMQPDGDHLKEDEETAERIEDIENLIQDDSAPIERKIKELAAFNATWFPDGLPSDEQKAYRSLLDRAVKLSS